MSSCIPLQTRLVADGSTPVVLPAIGALDVNENAALSYKGTMDPVSGSVGVAAMPGRVRAG
jgi:hypothetical protein